LHIAAPVPYVVLVHELLANHSLHGQQNLFVLLQLL